MFLAGSHEVTTLGGLTPSGIYLDGLIGDFDPNNTGSYPETGVNFNNLVSSGPDLELKNGTQYITGMNSRCFKFDGTNDYISYYDGYYNSQFALNLDDGFTICSWWHFEDNGNSLENSSLIGFGDWVSNRVFGLSTHNHYGTGQRYGNVIIETAGGGDKGEVVEVDYEAATPIEGRTPSFESVATGHNVTGKWHMISITKRPQASYFDLYFGPSFEPLSRHSLQPVTATGALLEIGRSIESGVATYAPVNSSVGRILIYEKKLENSQIRRNYFATKKVFDVGHWNLYTY